MARAKKEKIGTEVKAAVPAKTTTPVRNSPVPKTPAAAVKKEIGYAQIAERAYYISISGTGGSEFDNWVRAEKELRGE